MIISHPMKTMIGRKFTLQRRSFSSFSRRGAVYVYDDTEPRSEPEPEPETKLTPTPTPRYASKPKSNLSYTQNNT